MIKIKNHLLEISKEFDVFIFDAYGVFNFGSKLSETAIQVMADLISQNKKVFILSNATYLTADAVKRYQKKSLFQGIHYLNIITSGQFAFEAIQNHNLPVPGNKCYVFGTANFQKPENKIPAIFSESSYKITENLYEADFVYCGIPQIHYADRTEIDDFIPELVSIRNAGLTMICANPDLRAYEDGKFVVRQGLICAEYEKMGGKVIYYGKPDPMIFERVLAEIPDADKNRVIMIGDTIGTDILGANRAGIKSCLLIENGVTEDDMRKKGLAVTEENISHLITEQKLKLDYICRKLPEKSLF